MLSSKDFLGIADKDVRFIQRSVFWSLGIASETLNNIRRISFNGCRLTMAEEINVNLSVERLGGKVMHMVQDCPHCGIEARCRRREFSEQTWSVMLAWGEVEVRTVDKPICESCYNDLREILIDRADEVAKAVIEPLSKVTAQAQARADQAQAAKTASAKKSAPKKKAASGRSKRSNKVA